MDDLPFSPPERRAQEAPALAAPAVRPLPWPPPARAPAGMKPAIVPGAAAPAAPASHRAKAGLGVIAAATGIGVGAALGGLPGAALGVVGVGAARNLYRAQGIGSADGAQSSDATRSFALGVIGLGIMGYLSYKLFFEDRS